MSGWPVKYEKIIRYPDYSFPYLTPPYPRYTCIQECVPLCRPCNHVACSAAGAQIILNKKGEPIDVKPIPISKSSVKISRGRSKRRGQESRSEESRSSSEEESYSEYSDDGQSSSNYKSSSRRRSKNKGSKNRGGRRDRKESRGGRGGGRGGGSGGERGGGGEGGSNITDVIKDGKEIVDNAQGISDTFNQTATNIRDLPSRCTILWKRVEKKIQ